MRLSISAVLLWLATIALLLGNGSAMAQASNRVLPVDRIVAVVNSEVITAGELAERVKSVTQRLRQGGTQLPDADLLQRQVLERMIMDRLQLQLAKETALRVDDLQLDRTVARVAENNKMSLSQFRAALERDGIQFDKFREEIRNEILLSRLREREVDSRIVVSDNEIDYFLSQQDALPAAGTEFNLSHIVLLLPEQASPEQVARQRARAEDVLKQLRAGADFAKLAVAYSDVPDALQGGAMGWRSRDRLPDLYAQAVEHMKPGEVSDIVETRFGYQIIMVSDIRKGKVVPFEKVKASLVRRMERDFGREKTENYVSSLRKNAQIEIFSK